MHMFKTIEDMERFYYGDINSDMILKAKDALLSSDTAFWNKVYGAKVWSQINYERNAAAALPLEPFNQTGWRIATASGDAFPSGGLAEGVASNFTDIKDTTHPTWASASAAPKLIDHGFGATWKTYTLADIDDNVPLTEMRQEKGQAHARAISAYFVQDTDTTAGNGLESLDRIAASSASRANGMDANDCDIYGLDRDGTTAYDAQVSSSGSTAATLRDLTVSLIDGVWSSVTKAGGKTKVIFTGYNTIRVWSALLEAERRFNVLGEAMFVPRAGGAAGVTPGYEAGFSVATYFGVPIIPCQDYDSSIATVRSANNEVAPIMFADTDYIRFAVRMPTVYKESRYPDDVINLNGHGMEGHYFTIGELKCYNLVVQGKLRDIK